MAKLNSSTLTFIIVMVAMAAMTYQPVSATDVDNLPFCLDNTSCALNSTQQPGDVCCGFVAYNKNSIYQQTLAKCLIVANFPDYWNVY